MHSGEISSRNEVSPFLFFLVPADRGPAAPCAARRVHRSVAGPGVKKTNAGDAAPPRPALPPSRHALPNSWQLQLFVKVIRLQPARLVGPAGPGRAGRFHPPSFSEKFLVPQGKRLRGQGKANMSALHWATQLIPISEAGCRAESSPSGSHGSQGSRPFCPSSPACCAQEQQQQ